MARKTERKQEQEQHVMSEAIAGREDLVPLSVLWLSKSNVRGKRDPESIKSLAALILQVLLQSGSDQSLAGLMLKRSLIRCLLVQADAI